MDNNIKALKFTALEGMTGGIGFRTMYSGELGFQFSRDGETWEDILPTTSSTFEVPFATTSSFYIRGMGKNSTSEDQIFDIYNLAYGVGAGTNKFKCEGNIMYLIDYTQDLTEIPENLPYCFYHSFMGTEIVGVPELPATGLTEGCYQGMFESCEYLTKAPELPATKLAGYCYTEMFKDCTALVEAPELPATKLTEECYYQMFGGCSSIVNAPDLPATSLAPECYRSMFEGCTSLTKAPKIAATSLAEECCMGMFSCCESLEIGPELLAQKGANECYQGMFYNCTNLKELKCYIQNPDKRYFSHMNEGWWMWGVNTEGVLTTLEGSDWSEIDMPDGWTFNPEIYEKDRKLVDAGNGLYKLVFKETGLPIKKCKENRKGYTKEKAMEILRSYAYPPVPKKLKPKPKPVPPGEFEILNYANYEETVNIYTTTAGTFISYNPSVLPVEVSVSITGTRVIVTESMGDSSVELSGYVVKDLGDWKYLMMLQSNSYFEPIVYNVVTEQVLFGVSSFYPKGFREDITEMFDEEASAYYEELLQNLYNKPITISQVYGIVEGTASAEAAVAYTGDLLRNAGATEEDMEIYVEGIEWRETQIVSLLFEDSEGNMYGIFGGF